MIDWNLQRTLLQQTLRDLFGQPCHLCTPFVYFVWWHLNLLKVAFCYLWNSESNRTLRTVLSCFYQTFFSSLLLFVDREWKDFAFLHLFRNIIWPVNIQAIQISLRKFDLIIWRREKSKRNFLFRILKPLTSLMQWGCCCTSNAIMQEFGIWG